MRGRKTDCRAEGGGRKLLLALLLLGGCADIHPASAPAESTAQATLDPAARLAGIEHSIAALRSEGDPTKPSIARLEQVEGDIRSLVSSLEQEAARPAEAPAAEPPPEISAADKPIPLAPPAGAIVTAPIGPPPAPADGKFGVHLASYKLKESVAEGWSDYRKQYRGVLDGLQPRVAAIDLHDGRGTLYRLKAGPFASEAAARATCHKVEAYPAGYCKVMDFSGVPGETFWRRGGS
jgi:SPOR domain